MGNTVMGIDADPRTVQHHAPTITKVIQADSTDIAVLKQVGVKEFDHVVIGIGDVEASILTATELVELGIHGIWAKAVTDAHARILDRVGVTHVIRPEHDMGRRVAHLVSGRMMDFIELDPGFALVETRAPASLCGVRLAESTIRQDHGVTVVCIKPVGGTFTYATADTTISEGDILLVAGETRSIEEFAFLD